MSDVKLILGDCLGDVPTTTDGSYIASLWAPFFYAWDEYVQVVPNWTEFLVLLKMVMPL